jgi:hypothetical protein
MRGTDKHCSHLVDSNSRAGMTNLTTYDNKNILSKNMHTHSKPGSAPLLGVWGSRLRLKRGDAILAS